MLPPFNDDGYLPPGLHLATLVEIAERFGAESELRQAQMDSLRWLVDAARRAGVLRLAIDGSFVTDKFEPNDVDCVLLVDNRFPLDLDAAIELKGGFPFIELQIVRLQRFRFLTEDFLASDRVECPKGLVEVQLC